MSHVRSSLRPSVDAALLDVDPGRFRYSEWNNISIGVWADQATKEAAERVIRVSKWMAERHPGGHSNIIFVFDGTPAPTPEANQIFSRVYDEKFSGLACLGIIVQGTGFWASGIRSTITNQRLSVPGKVRVRVSDSVDELVEWFLPEHNGRTAAKISPRELRVALAAMRERGAQDTGETPQVSSSRDRPR